MRKNYLKNKKKNIQDRSERIRTVEEGNFEHLSNFEAFLKIWQIFFYHIFLAEELNEKSY